MKRFENGNWAMIIITMLFFSLCRLVIGIDSNNVSWRWSNPEPHGTDIYDFIIIGETGIQVGELGNIFWSSDKQNWNNINVGYDFSLRSIAIFDGRYYIGAESGRIFVTDDLLSFSVIDLNTDDWIEGIAASSSLIVAVGDNGSIYTSEDGVVWTARNSGTSEWLRDIEFGGNRFVAVGENGTIITSFNGVSWSLISSSTTQNLNAVANNGLNKFAIAGDSGVLLTSSNETSWSPVNTNTTKDLLTVSSSPTDFLAAGENTALAINSSGRVTIETDATIQGKLPEYLWQSSAYSDGSWYLTGSAGLNYSGNIPSDGSSISWSTTDQSLRSWIWDMAVVDDQLFAVGDFGTVLVSSDGISWDSRIVPEEITNKLILSVSGSNKGLVACGVDGLVLFSPSELVSSEEVEIIDGQEVTVVKELLVPGINWNQVEIPGVSGDLKGSTFHQGFYYLCGEAGLILRSENGTEWTSMDSGTSEFLSGISAKGNTLVAVGRSGKLVRSMDQGDSWQSVPAFTNNWLLQIRCLNDKYYAVGQGGVVACSENGATWAIADTPSSTAFINDITFYNGVFYASGTLGRVWQSVNGNEWQSLPTNTSKSLYTLSPFNGRLIVAGIEGVIIRTPFTEFKDPLSIQAFQKIAYEDQDYFGFLIQGKTDQLFTFEYSSNLSDTWEVFIQNAEITERDGTASLLMPVTEDPEKIFFRVSPYQSQ